MKVFWEKYERIVVIIFVFFFGLFLYTKLAGPIPFYVNNVNTTKAGTFDVDGTGTATAVPDTGVVNLGVTQTATTVVDAQNKTNTIANKLIADIKKLGVADKDIKTTNYSVNPNYGNNEIGVYNQGSAVRNGVIAQPLPPQNNQQIVSYTVTQNLEIDVQKTDKINAVIDTATADGANLVGQVSFSFSDSMKSQLENQARAEAIKNAKAKAQDLANLSGIHLGQLVNVVESNDIRPWPVTYMGAGKLSTDSTQTPPTTVTPGESTVSITITLSYETY